MIRIIDRYLFLQVIGGTFLALLMLTSLDAFFAFVGELDDVGQGQYGHGKAALYILFSLPRRMYDFAPTAVLLGSLLGLGALAGYGEMTAIRAAGLSINGIAIAVIKAGAVLVIAIFLLGETVAPVAEQRGEKMRTDALSNKQAARSASGLWVRNGDMFIHARVILNDKRVQHLQIYRFDDARLVEVVTARSAEPIEKGWLLKRVQKISLDDDKITRKRLSEEEWPQLITDKLFEVLRVDPDEMSAKSLSSYVQYLEENNLQSASYRLAFWNRFIIPLSSLVMLLLALPFVFASQRAGGAGQRLFFGILLGVGYFLLSRLVNQLGIVYGITPLLSALLPPLLFLGLAIYLLRRV